MATSSIARRFAEAMKLTLGCFAAQMGEQETEDVVTGGVYV
jgi:hypothetical protein